jgi:hypothetical protein
MPRQSPEKPEPIIAIRRVAEFFTGIVQTSWRAALSRIASLSTPYSYYFLGRQRLPTDLDSRTGALQLRYL